MAVSLTFKKKVPPMPLTDTAIRNAKPKEKQYKLHDAMGMYLLVKPAGGKYFRMNYRFHDKRKTLALGVYPKISLKLARQKTIDAHDLLENGVDPSQHKQDAKRFRIGQVENSFEYVALEWFEKNKCGWSKKHTKTVISRLTKNVFPWLGPKHINEISAPDLLSVLRRIEDRGAIEVAHRTKQICGQVFRYGIATGRCERDPSADLKGALTPSISSNMATITSPKEIRGLLLAIDDYPGFHVTRCAFRLAPLVFVRSGELRHAEWEEIDLQNAIWKIKPEKMKMKRPHLVPLSRQSIKILQDMRPLTGHLRYVFPGVRSESRPMSESALLAALRRIGYTKSEMCIHGFRSMASTLLHENGFPSHLIELQLAHVEKNKVKAAYNHALYLDERRKMMQWWADYLDDLRSNKDETI